MRESIPLVTDNGTFYVHTPSSRLGSLAYWRESFQKSAKEDVETYLGRQDFTQQQEIMTLAKEFHREDTPLASTVSLIPVAAHQESERIVPAVREFARQQTNNPFSILLYLNTPAGADHHEVRKTIRAIDQARKTYPDLDLRWSDVYEFNTPTIGKIRKNLWDSAIYLAYYEGLFNQPGNDVIGLNQDIDIEWMSKPTIRNIQQYYAIRQRNAAWNGTDQLKSAGTQLRHAYDHIRPNVSKVVQWRDLISRVRTPGATFEAGMVVPFSTYARSNGINEEDETYETASLVQTGLAPRIKHTLQTTSPRRFGDRLHDTDVFGIWEDDSFGANDACRTGEIRGDISTKRAKKLIKGSLDSYIPWFFYQPMVQFDRDRNVQKLDDTIRKRKHLAVSVLRRLDTSGELAQHVEQAYLIDQVSEDIQNYRFEVSYSVA